MAFTQCWLVYSPQTGGSDSLHGFGTTVVVVVVVVELDLVLDVDDVVAVLVLVVLVREVDVEEEVDECDDVVVDECDDVVVDVLLVVMVGVLVAVLVTVLVPVVKVYSVVDAAMRLMLNAVHSSPSAHSVAHDFSVAKPACAVDNTVSPLLL